MRLTNDLWNERGAQDEKWGKQHHPDGTHYSFKSDADNARMQCTYAALSGYLTWGHILAEEFYEAMAEEEWAPLRAELVQVAAVCMAWIEDGDSRDVRD